MESFVNVCLVLLTVFSSVKLSIAFRDSISFSLPEAASHAEITETAILRAVARLFEEDPTIAEGSLQSMSPLTATALYKKFFTVTIVSPSSLQKAIDEIVNVNIPNPDKYHMYGEEIKEGNDVLLFLRKFIDSLLDDDEPNYTWARQWIGRYLHTLQDFYSNTNWIEIKGNLVYKNLGLPDAAFIAVAGAGSPTCTNCDTPTDECRNNIIDQGEVLTSGYRNTKPESISSKQGKCSHGGIEDNSRFETAVGGINKETPRSKFSPHFYLHKEATEAAVLATEMFLDAPETGLRARIGDDKFKQLLQIGSQVSLVFVIDISGSMGNDIAAVKAETGDIIRDFENTVNEPADYILSTFSDPENLGEVNVTTNSSQMIAWLNAISVNGGGDCPEYSMTGLLRALQACKSGSNVYLFTDADAKDIEMREQVSTLAAAKEVTIHCVLTGSCSRKRRSVKYKESQPGWHKRYRRSSASIFYKSLVEDTGGVLYQSTKADVGSVVAILKESVKTATVTVTKFSWVYDSNDDVRIIVIDTQLVEFTLEIKGTNQEPSVEIYKPNASTPLSGGDIRTTKLGSFASLYTFQNASSGTWTIKRLSNDIWDVLVTGQSLFDFSYAFVEEDLLTGVLTPIAGKPIAESEISILVRVTDGSAVANISNVTLVDTQGRTLAFTQPVRGTGKASGNFKGDITIPNEKFFVVIYGKDTEGNILTRVSTQLISALSIKLIIPAISDELHPSESLPVQFTVLNNGPGADVEVSIVADPNDVLVGHTSLTFSKLSTNENSTGTFYVNGNGPVGKLITLTISAKTVGTTLAQSQVIYLGITEKITVLPDRTPPVCSITTWNKNCSLSEMDPCVCHQHSWSVNATVYESGDGLLPLQITPNVTLTYENGTGTNNSDTNITVTFGSDCCHVIVYLNAADKAGNLGQCSVDFSNSSVPETCITTTETTTGGITTTETNEIVTTETTNEKATTTETTNVMATTITTNEMATTETNNEVATTTKTNNEMATTTETNNEISTTGKTNEIATTETNNVMATTITTNDNEMATTETNNEVATTTKTNNEMATTTETNNEISTTETTNEIATTETNNEMATTETVNEMATTETVNEIATAETTSEIATTETANENTTTTEITNLFATTETSNEIATTPAIKQPRTTIESTSEVRASITESSFSTEAITVSPARLLSPAIVISSTAGVTVILITIVAVVAVIFYKKWERKQRHKVTTVRRRKGPKAKKESSEILALTITS